MLCAFTIFNSCSTIEQFQKPEKSYPWSSSEPLTIPYELRQAQFEKGNLVVNASFEDGFVFEVSSGNEDRIKSWQTFGENVYWLDV